MVYNLSMQTYAELLDSQTKISNQDFTVKKASNVLLPDQIEEIYSAINSTDDSLTRIQPWAGHKIWDIRFSKEIEDRITTVAQSVVGEHVALDFDYSFARYSPKFGYKCKLFPHYDNRDSQRITFDIQLRTTEPWAVVVEEQPFYLEDNQALIFAGTQQIHWREAKDIAEDAEIDMIFCHLSYKDPVPLDDNQKNILNERSDFLIMKTGISNEVIKNEAR
jgi:hypothetical protein